MVIIGGLRINSHQARLTRKLSELSLVCSH